MPGNNEKAGEKQETSLDAIPIFSLIAALISALTAALISALISFCLFLR